VAAGDGFAVLLVFLMGVSGKSGFWVWCFGGELVVDCWWECGDSLCVFQR
jgi:hypothetical protein